MGKGILKKGGEEIHSNGYPPQQTRKKKNINKTWQYYLYKNRSIKETPRKFTATSGLSEIWCISQEMQRDNGMCYCKATKNRSQN